MKAYKKESKILFKNSLNRCINNLNNIINKVEDKNNEIFPTDEISKFLTNCKLVIEESDNLCIPKEYLDFVKNNKEVLRYFIEKEKESLEKTEIISSREKVIDDYKKGIEKFL